MKTKTENFSKKITLLNKTILDSTLEKSDEVIIKDFVDTGIKILEADFGYSWWKFNNEEGYRLAYKSPSTPYNPPIPRTKGGNDTALRTKKPYFDSDVKRTNYPNLPMPVYMKSYIIVPIHYGNHLYGNLIFCYKNKRIFNKDDLILAQAIGNTTAQAITIHKLVAQEKEALALKEKQKATDLLLEQEKLKNEFIANTTHEFRTPLTIMRGHIYLATKNSLDSKEGRKATEEALKIVDEEIVNLSELLSDLVLLTAGKAQRAVELAPVNIAEIVNRAAEKLKTFAKEKNITIKTATAKDITILGDEKYLQRVFLNLVRNAITYGGTKIHVTIEKNKKSVVINIKDDGIGISKENLPRIFERFFRADKSHNREGGHSGLGLPIAKWIIELHKGKIDVKSALGVGSTFTVTLPLRPSKKRPKRA